MAPTDPNSDYNTPSTDLFQYLPEPFQSDTNRSVMSNLFNRFLSKSETVHSVGYIGQGNINAVVPRQIKEPTVHRQAYQLQPILYEKIGSVEHINSWYDILNGLTAQGVDVSRQNDWASALLFNWAPPIDINKIVNYRDYYWYDPQDPQSQPQYITVKSECAAASALVNFYSALIAQYNPPFNIIAVDPTQSSITIQGNYTQLFAPKFLFFIENTSNLNLNNTFQQVVSSSYDSVNDVTTIIISGTFTDSTVGGDISLSQILSNYQGIANCKCIGAYGWDEGPWDDNPSTPVIWDAPYFDPASSEYIAYPTLALRLAGTITPNALWWDTTTDVLYVLEDSTAASDINSWKPIYYSFSYLVSQISGTGYWDLSTGCTEGATIVGLDQWISQNKWMHKADVPNFSIAKQAQAPIIEFEPNLELNEWIVTSYNWQYRTNITYSFNPTTVQPTRFELEPINAYTVISSTQISIDERFGNLTNVFVPGVTFSINGVSEDFTVVSSQFVRSSLPLGAFNTIITVQQTLPTVLTPSANYLYPRVTSLGDPFTSYGDQWLFAGAGNTLAVNHQMPQTMMTPSTLVQYSTTSNYTTNVAPYAEQFNITVSNVVNTLMLDNYVGPGSSRPLTQRALVGMNDIRVYINGIRQYDNYAEIGSSAIDIFGNEYVIGITFDSTVSLQKTDTVLIQVGEATYQDFGNYAIPVRTIAEDTVFQTQGFQYISLVQYRLNEQVKTEVNQYPLFDMYNIDSVTTNTASPIFGFYEAPSGTLYPYLGQRVVLADDGSFMFQNYLVESNNGPLLAYRNYNKVSYTYWFNTITNQVLVWTGETWSNTYETSGGMLVSPVVQAGLPSSPYNGMLVFNTENNTLNSWNGTSWANETVLIAASDITLETNWRHGINNEQFVPAQVDWQQRSYPEYEQQYNTFIQQTSTQLLNANPLMTQAEAEAQADAQWTTIQERWINPAWYSDTTTPEPVRNGPLWIGNWQVPDPLYFNPNHEDWQYISAVDLQAHFSSIVNAQPSVPGFNGLASANWRLIDYTQVDWALGGTIHEYDNSFDTFLSSQFIKTITPPTLFNFAQTEYDSAIIQAQDLLIRNYVSYMTNTNDSIILDPSAYISSQVLTLYEEDEAQNLIYGDSTTYIPATSTTPAVGVQNWIATLPFFGIIPKVQPYMYQDTSLGILGIMHHDGHRQTYNIPNIILSSLQRNIVNTPDSRAPGETIGRVSSVPPPSTQAQFISQFSSNMRNGVYWLHGSTLYRIQLAGVGPTPPSTNGTDGLLWWDTGTQTLRQLLVVGTTYEWNPVPGVTVGDGRLFNGATIQTSTISAWQVVDLNELYLQAILNIEQNLYNAAPPPPFNYPIDFESLQTNYAALWDQYMLQQFTNYTIESQISSPFVNNTYNINDPFTWNYKYSIVSQPPRTGIIQSGGTWQDVYEKAYGTPYPHLEPWVLQGYTQLPSWWNSLYANNDPANYGARRWKYIHDLPVVSLTSSSITFSGDIAAVFQTFASFTLYLPDGTTKQTVTVSSVSFDTSNDTTIVNVNETLVPTTGSFVVNVGMWDYILRGIIPTNYVPPSVPVPSYSYVSVNISNQSFAAGVYTYAPDDLFPPYWNNTTYYPSGIQLSDLAVRSIFTSLSEINLENADYQWLDAGPIEWQWRQSTSYLYSMLTVAYLLEPVRTIASIFGINYAHINELPIDRLTGQVFSHGSTQFHGEMVPNTNQIIKINGINQWYVNYNRASGFDTSYSDFRARWTGWTAPLTHQFSGFIDTSSLTVDHRVVAITSADYSITMKRSPGVSNSWIDSFAVQVLSIPPELSLYNTESDWVIQFNSQAPVARTISYYDIQRYDYYIDPSTSICYLYTYPIVSTSTIQNSFTVGGDVTQVFGSINGASQFQVTGSNNGIYTVVSSLYDDVNKVTTIIVKETIPTSVANGLLTAINYKTLPWNTGTIVLPTSTDLLPLPLEEGKQYYIIKLSPTSFQYAYNTLDVTANTPILFTSQALGIQRVGALYNSFTALAGANTNNTWYHYQIDKTSVRQLQLPSTISGIQTFINIIDGYSSYISDQGFAINLNGQYIDPVTGQQVSWQNEVERFVDWAYQQRTARRSAIADRYPVQLNYTTSELTYSSQNPGFTTGQQVVVWSVGGGLPTPLITGQLYFVINNTNGTISLASNYTNALEGNPINVSLTNNTGQLYISTAQQYTAALPTYEINPFRNALWYSPQFGILSNVITGPFQDIYSTQVIFDQYGRRLSSGDIRVFRQDKITQVQYASGVYNDTNTLQSLLQNPYLYLHIGGANLYIDTYEHIMQFNNYTTAGALLYDPFIGLNVTKYELDFYKQDTFTERPNVGGYFLSQPYNTGAQLLRNIEGSLEDLRNMYDPYQVPETLPAVQHSRSVIGYPGTQTYLSQINLTAKSQFLFWKGTIHNKGSLNMVKAFINSRRFIDAKVDEFWAYKIADFGATQLPEYLNMWLEVSDTVANELRLEFIQSDLVCLPGYQEETFGNTNCGYANPPNTAITVTNTDPSFIPIAMNDETRWYNQPNVIQQVVPDGGLLYFNLIPKQKLVIYPVTLVQGSGFNPLVPTQLTDTTSPLYISNLTTEIGVICWDSSNTILTNSGLTESYQQNYFTFWVWDGTRFEFSGGWDGVTELPYLRHNFKADNVTATMSIWPSTTYSIPSIPSSSSVYVLALNIPYLPLTNSLSVYKNGVELQVGVDYVESLELYAGSQVLGYKLYFAESVSGSTIEVVYGTSQLSVGTQFEIVNTNIINLVSQELIQGSTNIGIFNTNTPLTLWGWEVDKEALNPAEVIDEQAQVVLTPVTYWDPARGYHYYEALNSIDIQSDSDPANYDISGSGLAGWQQQMVGTVWLDTSNMKYLPYYDPYVLQNVNTRFADWGQLADFGSLHVYEWTASQYPPTQYNAIAAVQQNNSAIDPSVRLSGTVRQTVQYRTRTSTDITITPTSSGTATIVIGNETIFPSDPTGLVSTTTYSFTITVDSNTRTLSYTGAQFATFGDLINVLSTQFAQYGASIILNSNTIVITSNSVGPTSIISITNDTLFSSIVGYVSDTSIPGSYEQIVASNASQFAAGDTVLFYSTGTLPAELVESTVYTIAAISGNVILIDGITSISSAGTGTITMGNAVWPSTWINISQQQYNLDPYIDGTFDANTSSWTFTGPQTYLSGQTVNIYINGKQVVTGYTITGPIVFAPNGTLPLLNSYDRVTLIVPVPTLTQTQLSFNPSIADNGSTNIQYQYATDYVSVESFDATTNTITTTYYYWVENKTTTTGQRLTTSQTAADIVTFPAPFMFFSKLISPALIANSETGEIIDMPWRFSQAIIRGLRGYVDVENRYTLRFIRDFTLRDSLKYGTSPLQLKDTHQEWLMFREGQYSNVPQDLWNKVTEAMAGYLLSDQSTRVPSLSRQLYDETYGTYTQYGLGIGQAFCDGPTAIATVSAYLNDPNNNFYPLDMDLFFATYNFNTPSNCVATMNYIYDNFSYEHVNAIFFSVLLDALSVQPKYAGLMKTSAVALYGIELLNVQGVFDD